MAATKILKTDAATLVKEYALVTVGVISYALGWSIFLISAKEALSKITTRATLIPPPVEPAQAPMNISRSKMPLGKLCQALKSTVE